MHLGVHVVAVVELPAMRLMKENAMRTPSVTVFAGLALVAVAAACSDTDLYVFVDPDSPMMRNELKGEICAPPDIVDAVPYKILFVVDTSFSNSWTDPAPAGGGMPRRERAVRDAIEQSIDSTNVSYGIITYSDEPRRQTFGFTRDLGVLNGAAANIANAQGGTNYSDTMWSAIDFLLTDVAQVDAEEAKRTRYLVYWLSDGFPTVAVTDPAAILPGVTYLKDTMKSMAGDFHLNTAFLGGGPAPQNQQELNALLAAKKLLGDMATAGDGKFVDIPGGNAFSFEINAAPMVRRFQLVSLVASNRSVRFGSEHPLVDSDMDGLTDFDERRYDTDPRKDDTDGDGVRDGVEISLQSRSDPHEVDLDCPKGTQDKDNDGLRDCEELLLGTSPELVDTDGDKLPDSFEFELGTSPLSNDPLFDGDIDGIADWEEVLMHLAPNQATSYDEALRWAYGYEVVEKPTVGTAPPCYAFTVSNVAAFQTLASGDRPLGWNSVDIVAGFETEDGSSDVEYKRATSYARFLLPDVQEPADGRLNYARDQFVQLQLLDVD